jgi:YfiH family protein
MTTRQGGASAAPWAGFNLGDAVSDAPDAVAANRAAFAAAIGAAPVWLRQVHGTRLVRVTHADAQASASAGGSAAVEADASLTTEPGVACTVQVADCLPLLYADRRGRAVAAAHAGWRGLAAGIAEKALLALCEAASCEPAEVRVWLGACIGAGRFEVGADVLRAFGCDPRRAGDLTHFAVRGAVHPDKWLADLRGLARDRLAATGARDVEASTECTAGDASRFFSFRRDGVTGRMAAAVWLRG